MSLTTLSRAALLPLTFTLHPLVSIAARTTTHHQRHQLHQSPNLKSLATFYTFHLQCPSFLHSYSTMSNPDSMTQANTTNNNQQYNNSTSQNQENQQQQEQQQPYLSLPDTSSSSGATNQLDLSGGGSAAKLDHLGPMVVNVDGTLSRISNWGEMTEIEKKTTLRVLGKRNKQRLDALKAAEGVGAEGGGQDQS